MGDDRQTTENMEDEPGKLAPTTALGNNRSDDTNKQEEDADSIKSEQTNSSGVTAMANALLSTSLAPTASVPTPTTMASHAPIRMKLGTTAGTAGNSININNSHRKPRKRKHRPSGMTGPTNANVLDGGSDSSMDEDSDSSETKKTKQIDQVLNEQQQQRVMDHQAGQGKPASLNIDDTHHTINPLVDANKAEDTQGIKSSSPVIEPEEPTASSAVPSTPTMETHNTSNMTETESEASPGSQEPGGNNHDDNSSSNDNTHATVQPSEGSENALQPHSHIHHHHHRPGPTPSEQPDGWRVKLYRLNLDGSWDDCGTGRILCLYHTHTHPSRASPTTASESDNPDASNSNNNTTSGDGHTSHSSHNFHPHSIRPEPHQTTDQWLFQETGEATLCVQAELTKANRQSRVLLRTRILLRDPYQRQGDNIITWCEPFYGQTQNRQLESDSNDEHEREGGANGNNHIHGPGGGGVDLALSFQDNAGCLDIWRQITQVQSRAAELLRSLPNDDSVQRMAAAIAAQHHVHMQQQVGGINGNTATMDHHHLQQPDLGGWGGAGIGNASMLDDGSPGGGEYMLESPVHLPDPPSLANIEQIGDTIAAIHNVQQREAMANVIAKDECAYLRALLSLFPEAEERNDYGKLATLAACVKTILLLNEPAILELVVAVAELFEQVCSCLEYDPDLREKANHRWFLRERVKFRTVVAMENTELVGAIHRSFRVNFMRDTLLRPTMDESSLSTLSSLQTFSHADVVKGVTMSPNGEEVALTESYLIRVIRMLGMELHAIRVMEWMELDHPSGSLSSAESHDDLLSGAKDPSTVLDHNTMEGSNWKQYLAPQDSSLASRKLRRRGCLSFLRELFNMVRLSLQQNDKDDFFSVISTVDVDLVEDFSDAVSQTSQMAEAGSVASTIKSEQTGAQGEVHNPTTPVSLLSLLGDALADPNMDASEKGSVLEIISGIAMQDPSFIRRHCIDYHASRKEKQSDMANGSANWIAGRPDANEKKQVIHIPPQHDLMAALVFLLNVTVDAGILLQATEIVRIILDTDIIGDTGSIALKDEGEGMALGQLSGPLHDQPSQSAQAAAASNDQKQFFSLFYEHYMEWLVAPFQFTLLHSVRTVPEFVLKNPSESETMRAIQSSWRNGASLNDRFLQTVPFNAIRSSFAIELLSFCVRAHLYRMKFFLLKSRVLGNVLSLLRPGRSHELSGDRSLKLAALRFLRSILSVHDEFYHRHIIQHDLFAQVFDALRENPVGDNLVSSSIVEMCDYIHNENIKSLIEYIVTKHLSPIDQSEKGVTSLEDVSSPYVSTLTVLREAYEANRKSMQPVQHSATGIHGGTISPGGSRYFNATGTVSHHTVHRVLSGKALEDQRKFQEADEEESYFESNNSVTESPSAMPIATTGPVSNGPLAVPMKVDEVDASESTTAGEGIADLHRTQRMFSLAQALNHLDDKLAAAPSPLTEANEQKTVGGEMSASVKDKLPPKEENLKPRANELETKQGVVAGSKPQEQVDGSG